MLNLEKSVRNKILLIVCSVFLLAMTILIPISRSAILTSFEKIEEDLFISNYSRTLNWSRKDLSNLEIFIRSWAESEDACFFCAGKYQNVPYVQLTMKTLAHMKLDFLLFMDDRGNAVKTFFPNGTPDGMDQRLIRTIAAELNMSDSGTCAEKGSGFMKVDDSVVMLTAWPIPFYGIEGPVSGIIVAGKVVDDAFLNEKAKQLGIDLSLVSACPGGSGMGAVKSGDIGTVSGEPMGKGPLVTGKRLQTGYISLRNLKGTEIAAIRISEPRKIYSRCLKTINDFLFLFFIVAITQMVIIFLVLDDLIVARISGIKESLKVIGRNVHLQGRIDIEGDDEITSLSRSINEMIDTLARVMENIPDPIVISGEEGDIILMNGTGRDITGYGSMEMAGLTVKKLTKSFYAKNSYDDFWNDLSDRGSLTFEAKVVKKDGTDYPVEFHSTLFSLGEKRFALSVLRDITERKQYELELSEKAFRDHLTGLANRYLFYDRLNMAFEKYRRNEEYSFALMMMDLDHFKEINDTMGHLAGDAFISEFASRLVSITRLEDTLARWGGDEFVFLVQNISACEQLKALIARLSSITMEPVAIDGKKYPLSFSVGIAIKDHDTMSPDDLLFNADKALYEAKRRKEKGLSVVFFSDDFKGNGNMDK